MKKGPAKKKNAPTPKRKYKSRKVLVDDIPAPVLSLRPSPTPHRFVAGDAEATLKHAIFGGIIDSWDQKDRPNFAQTARDMVFEAIFKPQYRWALEEYLQTFK